MSAMIRQHPDPILYRVAREVAPEDFEDGTVARVVEELTRTMAALEAATGMQALGLAAPQIGHGLRIFRMAQWPGAFVNPTITYVLGKPVTGVEQCFSLPGVELPVARAVKIRLAYVTVDGQERRVKMRDRDARVAQHEFDHLDGVTIVQRSGAPDGEEVAA